MANWSDQARPGKPELSAGHPTLPGSKQPGRASLAPMCEHGYRDFCPYCREEYAPAAVEPEPPWEPDPNYYLPREW